MESASSRPLGRLGHRYSVEPQLAWLIPCPSSLLLFDGYPEICWIPAEQVRVLPRARRLARYLIDSIEVPGRGGGAQSTGIADCYFPKMPSRPSVAMRRGLIVRMHRGASDASTAKGDEPPI